MNKMIAFFAALALSLSASAYYCQCEVVEDGPFQGNERLVRYNEDGTVDTNYLLGIYRPGECAIAKVENPHCKDSTK